MSCFFLGKLAGVFRPFARFLTLATFLYVLLPSAYGRDHRSPDVFRVRVETTAGNFVIEVHRAWSPHGADRFYHLVESGYYNDSRFFRVVPGRWAQFGVSSFDPLTFLAMAGLLSAVTAIACVIPALRATKVDPLDTLKAG